MGGNQLKKVRVVVVSPVILSHTVYAHHSCDLSFLGASRNVSWWTYGAQNSGALVPQKSSALGLGDL